MVWGLQVSEIVKLKITDVDSGAMQVLLNGLKVKKPKRRTADMLLPFGWKWLVLIMNSLQPAFDKQGFDLAQWKHAMHRHPQEYIRRKLRVVQTYHQTHSVQAVASQYHLHKATIRAYLNTYSHGGLSALCTPQTNDRTGWLTTDQEADFRGCLSFCFTNFAGHDSYHCPIELM